MSYRFVDSFRAGPGRNCSSILVLLEFNWNSDKEDEANQQVDPIISVHGYHASIATEVATFFFLPQDVQENGEVVL